MAMDKNEIESRVLEMLEEICDDEAVREERDVDLFEAGLLDSLAPSRCSLALRRTSGSKSRPRRLSARR